MEHTKYERLSLEDHSSTGSRPLLGSSPSAEGSSIKHRLVGFTVSNSTLLRYCAVTTTIMVILMAAILGQLLQNIPCQHSEGGKPFHAVLGSDPTYMSLDHKYDNLWDDFGSAGLAIKLPDDSDGGQPKHAAISMFHQLHCLTSLRNAIQQAREGMDPGIDWQYNNHWPHCMDYLRKTLLCLADDTIERRFVYDNGTIAPFIDGSQDLRKCGDNRRLIQLMKDHGKVVYTRPFP